VTVILVGVDGSGDAAAATGWTARLAAQLGASVVAVHAAGLLEHEHGDPEGAHLLPLVEKWTSELGRLPSSAVKRRVVNGEPVSALLRIAEEEKVDMLVVGTRGVGGRPLNTLGSTSLRLAEACPVPLVVVPCADPVPGRTPGTSS
jgi:nucleotide-binding universal stress UspA family protein